MANNETSLQTLTRRRTVLHGLGAGILAAAGIGTTGTVAAQSDDSNVTVVDVREAADPTLPVVDEVLVFVHGWFGSSGGPDQAADLAGILATGGYEADETVAFVYDASNPDVNAIMDDAAAAGATLAGILRTAIDEGVGSIRLVGHSLGGRVVLEALSVLEGGYVVDTVAPMGIAADGSTVTEGGQWYDGIAENATAVRNYYSGNDDVVGPDFGGAGDTALGAEGTPDSTATPATYTDVDVTDSVGNHGAYTSSPELGQDLADAITEQGDDDDPIELNGYEPQPYDGSDLYWDVDGNGRLGSNDVTVFFDHLDDPVVQNNPQYFDFSGSGDVSTNDVVTLFERL
ncbi:alpha/beta hydrolase [Halobacteria archaeon AArc-m2/3/4]|uniref:Alpha/beta hydrolase n=1 Tax=Natronoglomus mannanivorans TaxID=2979990 RepID=A0AAP2YWL8_9EURY|nr:alpha/beta hydrolase [Halobacteria archaeon AArc-xg1-1]MCU4972491.1 alpha/beta hydrolase [Halobacteria archaeon AArc-m2/3/4]